MKILTHDYVIYQFLVHDRCITAIFNVNSILKTWLYAMFVCYFCLVFPCFLPKHFFSLTSLHLSSLLFSLSNIILIHFLATYLTLFTLIFLIISLSPTISPPSTNPGPSLPPLPPTLSLPLSSSPLLPLFPHSLINTYSF